MAYFEYHYNAITYPKGDEENQGLRNAQIGAIHAISSYFTIENDSAAIVVMPTGSGKTAVLMMTPFILQSKKVLVVTPSRMVRGQIFDDFSKLVTLKRANVVDEEMNNPNVVELEHLYTVQQLSICEKADVIVTTPQGAMSIIEDDNLRTMFDLILIDEAHHSAASSWKEILISTDHAKQILFTATPFRLDNKELKGKMIYRYPLSLAYRDGIFGEITYIPIEEDEAKDLLIAKKAEEVFYADREQNLKHYLMVRTDTKEKAKDLEKLYQGNTSLNLKRIDSSMSNRTAQKCIKDLKDGSLDGIVCVDMLGEGFDFPNLKIAAIHVAHRSLSNTLQFIGRFARTNSENIGTAKFIAMTDDDLTLENRKLYTADAVWQDIIIDISERRINQETESKEYIEDFQLDIKKEINTDDFSLFGVRPSCHAKVYKVKEFNIDASFPENCNIEIGPFINRNDNTVVAVGIGLVSPKWLDSDNIKNEEYLLYIVHYQKETSLLFIYSQIKSNPMYENIADAFAVNYEKIPRHSMHKVLAGLEDFEIFNSGMQNRFTQSGESYKISAGSDVSQVIDASTGRMYSAGHVFCKANSKESEITIGYSSGSKMWSSSYASLQEYVNWCDINGLKVSNKELKVKTNTNFDYLPIPQKLEKYTNDIFFIDFDGDTYSTAPSIYIGEASETTCLLTDAILEAVSVSDNIIEVSVRIDTMVETITCDLEGNYKSKGNKFYVSVRREKIAIDEYFTNYPLLFRTTGDALIQGAEISAGDPNAIVFDSNKIHAISWIEEYKTRIDIEVNDPTYYPVGKSIQTSLLEILKNNEKLKYIIFDHSRGEIADYITVEVESNTMLVTLYHVKSMKGERYNSDVYDIYEVTSQAVKSSIWLKSKASLIAKIRARRSSQHCIFILGEYNDFSKELRQANIYLEGKIVIVQPAISKNEDMPGKFQEVLAAAQYYISNSGRIKALEIWGSK